MYLYDKNSNRPIDNVSIGTYVINGEIKYETKTNKAGKFKLDRKWSYNTPCNDRLNQVPPTLFFKKEGYLFTLNDSARISDNSYSLFRNSPNGDTIFINLKSLF